MTMGQRVRDRRKALGLTQEQLAYRAPVSLKTLQRLESGRFSPSMTTLRAVAGVLGCSVADLLDEAA